MKEVLLPQTLRFPGILIRVPSDWEDVTGEMEEEGGPITLSSGVEDIGALQLSLALYKGGADPQVCLDDLSLLLHQFGLSRNLGDPLEPSTGDGALRHSGALFHSADQCVRVWYLSDGKNLVLITYVCPWKDRGKQEDACRAIVDGIRFE